MVDGIGENDMLCEQKQYKQYKIRGDNFRKLTPLTRPHEITGSAKLS
jgi:hypothetical protein